MKSRTLAVGLAAVTLLLGACSSHPERPVDNVSVRRHPNIAEAQRLVSEAYDRVSDAQQANGYDLNGHAARAKELLAEASAELKLSAEAANGR